MRLTHTTTTMLELVQYVLMPGAYCVPAGPLYETTHQYESCLNVTWVAHHIDIRCQVEDQVDQLNCCFNRMQGQDSLPPGPPEHEQCSLAQQRP